MKTKRNITIGLLFILAGTLISSQRLIDYFQGKNTDNFVSAGLVSAAQSSSTTVSPAENSTPLISGKPQKIIIPSAGIALDVKPGYYNSRTHKWTLSNNAAHFASVTPEPNNHGGNTLIYGHNRASVFRNLSNLKPGAETIITTANNHTFKYSLVQQYDTEPTDISLFSYRGKPILTLQTCSGLFYQDRRFYVFALKEAS